MEIMQIIDDGIFRSLINVFKPKYAENVKVPIACQLHINTQFRVLVSIMRSYVNFISIRSL